jgi:predicted nucleotidyltransferase
MRKNFLNISEKIESNRLAALEEIANIANAEDIPFFIVGAAARDLILADGYNIRPFRATLNIDIGVRVSDWSQYKRLKESLTGTGKFRAAKEFQRLKFLDRLVVDLIPFGSIADKTGYIKWPPNGEIVMHIIGFEEAFANSQILRVCNDPVLEINIVTLASLTVMKIISWNDGYPNRRKDASDIAIIMSSYTDAGNIERIFNEHPDLLDSNDFDYVRSGSRLLGRDIVKILSADIKETVLEIIERETEKQDRYKLIEDMLLSNILLDVDFNTLLGLMEEVKKGILESI